MKLRSVLAVAALAIAANVAAQAETWKLTVTDVEGMERLHLAARSQQEIKLPYGFFKMIACSGDLPNNMIMVGAPVPEDAKMMVRDAILETKDRIIAGITAHEENDKYVGMDLVSIEDSAYDYVRSMYSNAGYPQFDNFIGE